MAAPGATPAVVVTVTSSSHFERRSFMTFTRSLGISKRYLECVAIFLMHFGRRSLSHTGWMSPGASSTFKNGQALEVVRLLGTLPSLIQTFHRLLLFLKLRRGIFTCTLTALRVLIDTGCLAQITSGRTFRRVRNTH